MPLTLHEVTLKVSFSFNLLQKCRYIQECDSPEEGFKEYDYEGEGSVISSIDNCSYNESNDDLEFLNNLGSKFTTLAEVCGFRQTQSMSQADPKVTVNTVETTPTTTAFTAVSSNHMTNTVQPSPVEITVKSPLVQTAPSQGMVIQEPMYYGFNQPMQNNVFLSDDGLGQGVYIINGTAEADRLLTQGNGHALAQLGSGQQGIISDSIFYSQIGPQNPVMINQKNLVMMPQQQLDRTGSLQMVQVPVGSAVSGENGQGRVTLIDGSVNGGMVLVGGPNHHPMGPQQFYPISSQELSGAVHMNQSVTDGSFSNAQNDGQGKVTILEGLVNGGNVLVGGPGAPNLVSMPQIANGQVNNQLLVSGPFSSVQNIVAGEGGQSRLLVNGHSILEGPNQRPLAISSGLPQVANKQLFRSTVSKVLTSMVMTPKSRSLVANRHLNV